MSKTISSPNDQPLPKGKRKKGKLVYCLYGEKDIKVVEERMHIPKVKKYRGNNSS